MTQIEDEYEDEYPEIPEEIRVRMDWALDIDEIYFWWTQKHPSFEEKTPQEVWGEDKERVIQFINSTLR